MVAFMWRTTQTFATTLQHAPRRTSESKDTRRSAGRIMLIRDMRALPRHYQRLTILFAGEARHHGREGVHVRLVHHVVGNAPAGAPGAKVLDHLVNGADQHVGALQHVGRAKLRPGTRESLDRAAAVVARHDPLHQSVELEPREPLLARGSTYRRDARVDGRA